ncbi:hypothetical protein [Neolewinella agarilytica]|uniref:Uncharacterized protein n=1 Tax=Neolewinella agarilytica TaxID=478744 RepID=A0A1H9LWZ9_9BACT|nr:hypothetical protein [Neolewinella agarilytica]SER16002.1 hypothetical protein SAMN05444359_12619 [Neolewinella agarilytica]
MKTRIIPGFAGGLIARALDIYAPRLISFIPSPALQTLVMALLMGCKNLVRAISDSNPDNGGQVNAIVKSFFSVEAIPLAAGVIKEKIASIVNPRLSRGLTLLSVPVLGAAELLADEDPDNAGQAEEVLDAFILNPEVQEYVVTDLTVPVLENVIKDPIILSFVLEALETGIAEGAEELADIEVFNRTRTVQSIAQAKDRAIAAA